MLRIISIQGRASAKVSGARQAAKDKLSGVGLPMSGVYEAKAVHSSGIAMRSLDEDSEEERRRKEEEERRRREEEAKQEAERKLQEAIAAAQALLEAMQRKVAEMLDAARRGAMEEVEAARREVEAIFLKTRPEGFSKPTFRARIFANLHNFKPK